MKRNAQLISVVVFVVLLFCSQSILFAQGHPGSFEFEGKDRNYEVFLPQNFEPNMPLVVSIHGYEETINWFKNYTLLHEIADTSGFIIVYPEAPLPGWNTGVYAPVMTQLNSIPDRNDVGFISALIDTLKQRYDVDMNRVYCCGLSGGGHMTHKLVGELGHRFAAIATVVGHIHDNIAPTLKPVRAFPILTMLGTQDHIVRWEGGRGNNWSAQQMLDFWIGNNGCSLVADTVTLPDVNTRDRCTVEKISYMDCSGESQLIFYKITDGGHAWPGSTSSYTWEGNKNLDINAGVEILNFFKPFENPLADMAFIQNTEVPPLCYEFTGDSIVIGAELYNPSNHLTEVFAYIRGNDSEVLDTLQLYNDGQHGDEAPDDKLWGARWLPPVIDELYEINLTSEDLSYGIIQDYFRQDTFSILSDAPDITLRVEDFHTGEALYGSEVIYGGNSYLTNAEGLTYIQDCIGEYSFVVRLDKYGNVARKYDVFSDTSFVISLVKDSYIKVLDRLSSGPVNGASVYYGNAGNRTDDEGMVTIKDYREEQFIYRVEHNAYFTIEDTVGLVPSDTLITHLTRLYAICDFYVSDETGPVSNQVVKMGGLNKKTDSDGLVRYLRRPARQSYTYSVERDCNFPVFDSLFVDIDTTVYIMLQSDTIVPELRIELIGDSLLQVSCSKSGMIYVVPSGTLKHPDSIQAAQIVSVPIAAGQFLEIPTAGLPEGDYSIYGIDACLNISTSFITDIPDNMNSQIRIYPNPANARIIVELDPSKVCTLSITSISGQVMERSVLHETIKEIDISSYPEGVYIISVSSKDFITTSKIIKL